MVTRARVPRHLPGAVVRVAGQELHWLVRHGAADRREDHVLQRVLDVHVREDNDVADVGRRGHGLGEPGLGHRGRHGGDLGFGRIVVSEIEAPNMLVNLV